MNLDKTTWIAIVGGAVGNGRHLRYEPEVQTEGEYAGKPASSVLKSNIWFRNGSVKFRVTAADGDTKAQLILGQGTVLEMFAGTRLGSFQYGTCELKAGSFGNFKTVGPNKLFPVETPVDITVTVKGSTVKVLVDGVEVIQHNYNVQRSQLAFLMSSTSAVDIEVLEVKHEEQRAFVVMQFGGAFDNLYTDVIKPVCEDFGLVVERADDIYNNGQILDDITRSIQQANVVIADVTPDNPNVYYELGYAHAISKPTILLSEKSRPKLPFDIGGFRTLFYSDSIGGKADVEKKLRKHLEAILTPERLG